MIGTFFFGGFALVLTSYLLNIGVPLEFTYETVILAFQVSFVLGVLNLTLKPILKVITIPFHILSFGLFGFVVNGFIVYLVSRVLPGFVIPSLIQGIYFSFFFTLFMRVYHLFADEDN